MERRSFIERRMISGSRQMSELVAGREPMLVAERHDPAEHSVPAIAASNVVPFARSRRDAAPVAPLHDVARSERPAPYTPDRDQRRLIVGLFALSLILHGGLYFVFRRAPEPMASVALEAISVEIVLGGNTPAGLATTPEASDTKNVDAKPSEAPVAKDEPKPDTPVPEPPVAETAATPSAPVAEPPQPEPVVPLPPEASEPLPAETPPPQAQQQQVRPEPQ